MWKQPKFSIVTQAVYGLVQRDISILKESVQFPIPSSLLFYK